MTAGLRAAGQRLSNASASAPEQGNPSVIDAALWLAQCPCSGREAATNPFLVLAVVAATWWLGSMLMSVWRKEKGAAAVGKAGKIAIVVVVAAVIAATKARRPVLVAWSYGTLVAMDYVREFGIAGLAGLNLTGALGALRPVKLPENDPVVRSSRESGKCCSARISSTTFGRVGA